MKFMDSLKLASNEVHVADIRTCVLHPASATHRQLTDEQLVAAGIDGGLIRLSVGLENVEDIINDLKQAFAAIRRKARIGKYKGEFLWTKERIQLKKS